MTGTRFDTEDWREGESKPPLYWGDGTAVGKTDIWARILGRRNNE